jgi:hypothetical protein
MSEWIFALAGVVVGAVISVFDRKFGVIGYGLIAFLAGVLIGVTI